MKEKLHYTNLFNVFIFNTNNNCHSFVIIYDSNKVYHLLMVYI